MALRRNIVIFHLGALGDFIVTWPLAISLARLYPQSRVFYVTSGQKGALAERVLRLESLDVDSGAWHRLYGENPDLPAPAAKVLAGAHTIVNFLSAPGDQWSLNVQAANAEANLLSINTVAPEDFAGHQTEFLADQLHPWPAAESAAKQIIHSIAQSGIGSYGLSPNGPVVIHPGGGAARKCWPAERYIELAGRLRAAGRAVLVLLGEVELERWPKETIAAFHNAADVCTPANLLELLSQISIAAAFIGNDSGPGHLAGILGVPTVSLFGQDSKPERWKPLGPRVAVIHQPLDAIVVDVVLHACTGLGL